MADLKVTYDLVANAAYIQLADPQARPNVASMYPCDPVKVGGMINLDFDAGGRLVGVEVLDARSKLPAYMLEAAERIDLEGT
ncbi:MULTISPECIES: DUF2283 domain-containing protein [Nonomuraea]|uniref:DUF2283 domain-containing protein n=1 Tax=Nonomuraea salmonea TaxID=46181 RepID=A0ABV5NH52_9ACTN